MADVFISYKSERRAAAARLAEVLSAYGFSVWWDYGLVAGSDFGPQIERQLRTAKAVVVLWCARSVASQWVRAEATLAKRLDKLVPACIEKVDPPLDFLLDHTIDLSSWSGAPQALDLERLMRDIGGYVGRAAQPIADSLLSAERAWRASGDAKLSELPLDAPLEGKFPNRALPPSGSDAANAKKGAALRPRVVLVGAGAAALVLLSLLFLSRLVGASNSPNGRPTVVEAAQRLQGRWRAGDDPSCGSPFTLAVSGRSLSFTGPDTRPYAEEIVALDADGAVRTDVNGNLATYRLENGALLFTYKADDAAASPTRYERCSEE